MPNTNIIDKSIEKMPEESGKLTIKEKIYQSKKQKTIAEKSAFVPILDAKNTIEVKAKPRPSIEQIETIEKPEQNKKEKQNPLKKAKKTITEKAKTPKIEKLEGNSILIITEKPQAAAKIAAALSNGRDRKYSDNGIPYYEFERINEKTKEPQNVIVACAVGHLFSLSQDTKGSDYPVFEISWKPNFQVRKKDFTKKYYNLLLRLFKRAREVILGTDFDIEGEIIGYNIIRFIGKQKDAKRMKYSSLTKDELEEAFKNVHPTIDWHQALAGETRHFIDWYYGINLSRALMNSIKTTGKFRIMSIGRVQGPALKLIVDKEHEIQAFKPIPYFKIFIDVQEKADKSNKLNLRHVKDIFDEKELDKFEKLKGKEAEVKTEKHIQTIYPPAPFDLTTLQTEAYKFFSIVPAKTLQIAQQLYLAGLISYPRTSSQKIPEAINPKNILKRLSKYFSKETQLATRAKPIEGKKTDPAHPSLYPTGEFQNLEGEERKIYELVVKRFISCFCENASIENKTITAEINELKFKAAGLEVKEKGWMEVYETKMQEKELRDMNGKADILKVNIEKDETKPPKRYSPASIVTELEKIKIGTKSTRANIIETLYDRGYIISGENKSIKATPLGINLIDTLKKYSPIIIDEKLTRNMEKDMETLQTSKKDLELKEKNILEKAKHSLIDISNDFKKKEAQVGADLIKAEQALWKQQNEQNALILCPICKKGILTIKYSPKNKKYFVACNKYPDCKTTFSLPPFGMIKKLETNKTCDKCNFPLLICIRKSKKPWIFCFNPQCESRKSGINAQEQENNQAQNTQEDIQENNIEEAE